MNRISAQAQKMLLKRRSTLAAAHQEKETNEAELATRLEPDWVDRSATREEMELLERLGDAERRELEEIDAALARIAKGTYGRCERCGQALGQQRLRAIPEARLCIGCSSEQERTGLVPEA